MSVTSKRVDVPDCREDLVKKAAESPFQPDFDWISDREALRVSSCDENQGLRAAEIRELAREWIVQGNRSKCVRERRALYEQRRYFYYEIIIEKLADFPRGLYVEMELNNPDPKEPAVNLLNAHPPRPS